MKRKLIKQANQAFTITLPIDWVRKNKLSEQSEVDVAVGEKSLTISTEGTITGGSVSIRVDGLGKKNLYLHIGAAYAKGFDEVKIVSEKEISPELSRILSGTIGFALVSQRKETYIIKDVSGGNYTDLDEIFKRVFQMILLFYEAAISDIFGKREATIEDLHARDFEVNKFCLFLERAINCRSYSDTINGRVLFTYSFALEKISDEIERLWRTSIKYDIKQSPAIKELMIASKESVQKAFELYYHTQGKKVEEVYAIRDKIREDSLLSLSQTDAHTARFVRHVIKIAEDAADLTHLSLMRRL